MALLHHPMTNRKGEVVTTAVTNLDIHDIARSACTYGMKRYFILTPIAVQHELVGRILGHWQKPQSKEFHPDRFEALSLVKLVHQFSEIRSIIREECGEDPEVVMTDARPLDDPKFSEPMSYADYRRILEEPGRTRPALIVFGTGWGIEKSFYPEVDRILAPIYGFQGAEGYNHLSVRAAVAIILDRLRGTSA
jgi:hypothetical protein